MQVHGQFDLDNAGNPRKAIDVTRIEPLDLSPMTFDVIRVEEVSSQLLMLWDEYGREKAEKLTKAAQGLQEALKKRIKEPKHAKV